MRIHFELTPNTHPVPINYQHLLLGKFHSWLSQNVHHDSISLYSLGWLKGGKLNNQFLNFAQGATWFISSFDPSIVQNVAEKALINPELFCGLKVKKILFQKTPDFGNKYKFKVGSPILIKQSQNQGKIRFLTYNDNILASKAMTSTIRHKLDIGGLNQYSKDCQITFDENYKNPKTKLVDIKGIKNRGSLCPVIIEGDPKALQFAWDVGVGNCTGSGFGSLL